MSNIKLKAPSGGSVQITPTDTAANYTVTLPATDGTVAMASDIPAGIVTLTGTQTLTNKTLTAPVVSSPKLSATGGGSITLTPAATASNYTVTFPAVTDTVATLSDIPTGIVTLTGTQTLTNKTLTAPVINSGVTITGDILSYGGGGIDTNTALGKNAFDSNTAGAGSTAIGRDALTANLTGGYNTAVGAYTLDSNTNGTLNTALGYNALQTCPSGNYNTAVGGYALGDLASGSYNTSVGYNAGTLSNGSYNTIVGANAVVGYNITHNIVLANGTGAVKAQHDGTNWTLTGNVTATGTMSGTDTVTLTGTQTLTNKTLTAPVLANPSYSGATANGGTVTTIDINGGTIDGTVIGGSSAAAGSFTTLSATGQATSGSTGTDGKLTLNRTSDGGGAVSLGLSGNNFSGNNGAGGNWSFKVSSVEYANISSTGLAVTGALSATGKATLGPTSGEQVALSNGTYASSLNYLQSYGDGAPRIRLGHYDSSSVAFPTGLVPSQILAGVTGLDISSRDIVGSQINLRAGAGVPVVATVSSTGLAVTGAVSATGDVTVGAVGSSKSIVGINTDGSVSYGGGTTNALGANIFCFAQSHATVPNQIQFRNSGNTTRMTLDSSGNLGLGVTPSAWRTTERGLEVAGSGGSMGALTNTFSETRLYNNAYVNTTPASIYKTTGGASMYRQDTAGTHSWHSAASGTAGTTFTFTQSLAVGLGTTLALQGATSVTGCGISFPATQVASSDANTLDDYEEGTWTPSVGGTATYTARTGSYTKKGREVTLHFDLTINAIGTGSAVDISGVPFANGAANCAGCVSYWVSSATAVVSISAVISPSGSVVNLYGVTAATTTTSAPAIFGSGTRVIGSITYFV